jgi:Fic family protein/DNA-binding XRE family transcriptional regulator
MKNLIKNAREQKGLKTREVANLLGIDQALISKFENGNRKPTKDQIAKLASALEIDYETLLIAWLKEKILHEIGQDEFAIKALNIVREELEKKTTSTLQTLSKDILLILNEIDILKSKLDQFRPFNNTKSSQVLELEYTFDNNRIEGNTLTLQETDWVINQGLTIAGKSMREHLEAINHHEAIALIKQMTNKNTTLNEQVVLSIHNLILRGILPEESGRYRREQTIVKECSITPTQPFMIAKEMEDFFIWYEMNKNKLHPIILAAELHERLFTIYPFIDGNGSTSRLVMNLILLQHGYVMVNLNSNIDSKTHYYNVLETAQKTKGKEDFLFYIAQIEKLSLERYLEIFGSSTSIPKSNGEEFTH